MNFKNSVLISFVVLQLTLLMGTFAQTNSKQETESTLKIEMSVWYLSEDKKEGYFFGKNGFYQQCRNGKDLGIQGKFTKKSINEVNMTAMGQTNKVYGFVPKKNIIQIYGKQYLVPRPINK